MANYSIKQENDMFLIYEDDVVAKTPEGCEVKCKDKQLAEEVAQELSSNSQCYKNQTLTAYLFNYCDLTEKFDSCKEKAYKSFQNSIKISLLKDDIFYQALPDYDFVFSCKALFDEYYRKLIDDLPFNILSAFITINAFNKSFALPYYIFMYKGVNECSRKEQVEDLGNILFGHLMRTGQFPKYNPLMIVDNFLYFIEKTL